MVGRFDFTGDGLKYPYNTLRAGKGRRAGLLPAVFYMTSLQQIHESFPIVRTCPL
ncbi:MAG TPA: hypothetical protein VEG44_03400 [Candidatus Acidoferrales bacterium]|nr:hypothetical protein [Candidatus Acidoferrales bacterium]